jgi:hypothetical protein
MLVKYSGCLFQFRCATDAETQMVESQPVLVKAFAFGGPAGVWGRAETQDNAAVAQQYTGAKFGAT